MAVWVSGHTREIHKAKFYVGQMWVKCGLNVKCGLENINIGRGAKVTLVTFFYAEQYVFTALHNLFTASLEYFVFLLTYYIISFLVNISLHQYVYIRHYDFFIFLILSSPVSYFTFNFLFCKLSPIFSNWT